MRVGSLFAGIGGFDVAAQWMGWETAWYSEIDPYASAVMAKHFPEARNHGDITKIDGHSIEHVDLLCGGFPCQDISLAGKGAGLSGARSGLWSHYARLIDEIRPSWVVIENVSALRSRGLDQVLGEVAALGYDAEWHCIPAHYVGAPHRRDRVWIIAHSVSEQLREQPGWSGGESWAGSSLFAEHGEARDVAHAAQLFRDGGGDNGGRDRESTRPIPEPRDGGCVAAGANTDRNGLEGQREVASGIGAELYHPGNNSWWGSEPNVGRVAHEFSFELDAIRGVIGHESNYSEADAETRERVRQIVRTVWEHRESAAASSDVYRDRLRDLVPSMSYERSRQGWLLGKRIEKDQELCDLWERVYAQPQQEAQDLLLRLLERIGTKKRPKEVGSRADRLKCLGNAIVPQVAYEIFQAIARHHLPEVK